MLNKNMCITVIISSIKIQLFESLKTIFSIRWNTLFKSSSLPRSFILFYPQCTPVTLLLLSLCPDILCSFCTQISHVRNGWEFFPTKQWQFFVSVNYLCVSNISLASDCTIHLYAFLLINRILCCHGTRTLKRAHFFFTLFFLCLWLNKAAQDPS